LKFPLKHYSGSAQDLPWAEFISKFDTCCGFNEVPEPEKRELLGFYLNGIPKSFYDEILSERPYAKYDVLCERMKEKLSASRGSDQTALELV
jgi:hypothetical protein